MFSKDPRSDEFEKAALPHLHELYRTASRLLGDGTKAEDAVQETYLQAWKSFGRFEPGTNCRAWLFKILIHTIHHQRRSWFRLRRVQDCEAVVEPSTGAVEAIPAGLAREEILRALARLPDEFRATVLLADVQEFAYKEIAEMLQVPAGTVMSRLSRGRRLLRQELRELAKAYGIGGNKKTGKEAPNG